MFPLRDDVPAERVPVVNWLLVTANVLVFVYMAFALPDPEAIKEFVYRWGLIPARVRFGFSHPELALESPFEFASLCVLPFFTAMFLHGGWAHLLGNVWFLIIFGDNVEGRLGARKYFVFYVVCGLVAWGLHIASIPADSVQGSGAAHFVGPNLALDVPAVGASGAIAGVLGAYAVLFPRARVLTYLLPIFFFEVRAILFLGLWFLLQFFAARSPQPDLRMGGGIAYWAHVGGFLAGLLLALGKRRSPRSRSSRVDGWS